MAMMFHSEPLRVILLTVHIPLAEVPRALTRELVEGTISLAARELPRFVAEVRRCRRDAGCIAHLYASRAPVIRARTGGKCPLDFGGWGCPS